MAQPTRIASWHFDTAELASRESIVPRSSRPPERVPGVDGDAVQFGSEGEGLVYSSMRIPIDWGAVSVRFWYRPDWSSRGVDGGSGPGDWAKLLCVGDRERRPDEGWWELAISPDGTTIEFSCGANARNSYTKQGSPVRFQKGVWTEIILNVFPGRVSGFKGYEAWLQDTPSKLGVPSTGTSRSTVVIGSQANGKRGARGAMDEVNVFDAPLDRFEVLKFGRLLSTRATSKSPALDLKWRLPPGPTVDVQRAAGGSSNWNVLAKNVRGRRFRDASVEAGVPYEYRLMTNGKPCGLDASASYRLKPVEDRGTIALLVDQTVGSDLAAQLKTLQQDLVADGWQVVTRFVPRHDDQKWANNTNAIARIRSQVQEIWKSSRQRLRCVYLIGHVAIPYTGMRAEDTHTGRGDNHYGAWPGDQYYGDVDGVWSDILRYPPYLAEPSFAVTRNDHGDGKFDTEWVPPNEAGRSYLEAAFGRVDFYGMPAFGPGRRGEIALLRQYLEKAHRYRQGEMPAEPRVAAGSYFNTWTDLDILPSAYRTGSRLFGLEEDLVYEADIFAMPSGRTAVWGFQGGGGHIDRIRVGTPGMVTSRDLTKPDHQARVLFAMLLGSWFGDWAAGENNLLRAVIASKDYGLASFWVRMTEWRFDSMALGGTLGDAQLDTANRVIIYNSPATGTTRTLTILGDPALRMHVTPPPRTLRGEVGSRGVRLTWGASPAADGGYYIYRSTNGWAGPYVRQNPDPIDRREFRDEDGQRGFTYVVRAAQLIETGSGSYTNLSRGIFWPEPR